MAAPIYSQFEADELLRMDKFVEEDAFEKAREGRPTDAETSVVLKAWPTGGPDNEDKIEFEIEIRVNLLTDAISMTLKGKAGYKPMIPLARYDVQDNEHDNPQWFTVPSIQSRVPHKHIYNERAIRELNKWDKCAEALNFSANAPASIIKQRLRDVFMGELNVRFSDSDTANKLF